MNTVLNPPQPVLGARVGPGFFVGVIDVKGDLFAIVVSPKAEGEKTGSWLSPSANVPGAASYFDGLANTNALAEAGSELAAWARSVRIGGLDDWYIPSRDELELLYRHLKPTDDESSSFSGDNPSSLPPGYPYGANHTQTTVDAFKRSGPEALSPEWYWSSTQFSRNNAWLQGFLNGTQDNDGKSWEARCRLVRRVLLSDLVIE
jgi:Protein of unknown function (DUF1566)